jgi:hypothetical protein
LTALEQKNNERYFISGHLNLEIIIWKICVDNFNHFLGLDRLNIINIDTIPYAISSINYERIAVSGKDGKIKIIDVRKGVI